MPQIFVNLKRFDVPRSLGGVCPADDPILWIENVIEDTTAAGLGALPGLHLTYLLPEGLLAAAKRRLASLPADRATGLALGCQGVHWEDIQPGGNFGAFTTGKPAKAMVNLGASWAIIGHSEERKALLQVLQGYDPTIQSDHAARQTAAQAVDLLLNGAVQCALGAGLNVLYCIGETAAEKGEGTFDEQQPRVESVLSSQLQWGLHGCSEALQAGKIVIGYEPVWAIGPGKVPPGREYIAFVSAFIQQAVRAQFDTQAAVVYGGGLKEENAGMIASIDTLAGGLVALTRFTGEIGFDVGELKGIVDQYMMQAAPQE
jgi:triosephosphate isomerase (TIM)